MTGSSSPEPELREEGAVTSATPEGPYRSLPQELVVTQIFVATRWSGLAVKVLGRSDASPARQGWQPVAGESLEGRGSERSPESGREVNGAEVE